MGDKAEGPKPVETGVAMNVVRRHGLDFRFSAGFLERQKAIQHQALTRAIEERKVKVKEGSDLLSLRVEAATTGDDVLSPPADEESCCLNAEEQKAYCETVDQCVDEEASTEGDKEALRVTMTEVIFKPKVFRIHYAKWKENYESSPALQQKYPTLEKYVLERAKLFIRARRNEIITSRLRRYQRESMPKAPSKAQQEAELKEMGKKTIKFVQAHEDELLEYSGLDAKDPRREKLFQKFLIEAGIKVTQYQAARALFEDIIQDIEVSFTAEKKLEARNAKMLKITQRSLDEGKEIDEESWNKMLDESLRDDPFFKEVVQQQQFVAAQPEANGAPKAPLDSPEAVAMQAGGLRIMGYDPRTDTYVVRYPDSTLETRMRIVPKPGSKTFDDATFIFYDRYGDKANGNEISLNSQNLRSGCNRMFLDYLMNDWIRKNKLSPDFSVNDILNDATMLRMAERLFGRNLNDVVLTKNMRFIFMRFLEVLMKGDSAETPYGNLGSFESRVKKMDTVLMNPNYAKLLYKEFEKVGSVAFTVSTLLEQIHYKA